MSQEFKGKTALVTGASRGIGAATAIALARNGVSRVIVHYGGYREGAEKTQEEVRAHGAECEIVGANFSDNDTIFSFVKEVHRTAPKVDILINNAGHLVKRAKLMEFTSGLYDDVMNLNVKSLWFITQAVVPHMIAQSYGIIVNVSSIAARNGGGPGATVYAAAKAAVACMTKGLARELAPKGIRVNAVSPGTVDNYFHEKHSTREILDNVVTQTPAGRLGTNEEVADTILFLCSEASRYTYGQTIEINGGLYMV